MPQEPTPPALPHTATALLRLYRPDEVATVLGCSTWWVKDRARRRLIPHTRVGRAYRFTADHLAEIIRLNEERPPAATKPRAGLPAMAKTSARRQPGSPSASGPAAARLHSRPPQRTRRAEFDTAA
ncbi:helix-turn-helix domain-containing protein [Streptomyces monticola]|uniref:Helix-turn-helix domain-containing protein n=1 Tax=Streptomyces monticola TaxID=2666263 RepID=A0ABW2JR66_9ACTN